MKSYLIIFLTVMQSCWGFSQNVQQVTCDYRDTLHGRVKSLIDVEYYICDDKKIFFIKTIRRFNTSGEVIEKIEITNDGYVNRTRNYKYNENGKLIQERDSSRERISVYTNQYNATGSLVEAKYEVWQHDSGPNDYYLRKTFYCKDGKEKEIYDFNGGQSWVQKTVKNYNRKNNSVESIVYSNDGKIISRETIKYDGGNNVIESAQYSSDGKVIHGSTTKYDKRNNPIEEIEYSNGDCSQYLKYITKYDKKNNRTDVMIYGMDGLEEHQTFKYDENNNEISAIYYRGDTTIRLTDSTQYNKAGKMIERHSYCIDRKNKDEKLTTEYDNEGSEIKMSLYKDGQIDYIEAHKFEYDKRHNWVKDISSKNYEPTNLIEREIEYYP